MVKANFTRTSDLTRYEQSTGSAWAHNHPIRLGDCCQWYVSRAPSAFNGSLASFLQMTLLTTLQIGLLEPKFRVGQRNAASSESCLQGETQKVIEKP